MAQKSRALRARHFVPTGIEVTRRVVARSEPVPNFRQVEAALEDRTLAGPSLERLWLVEAVVVWRHPDVLPWRNEPLEPVKAVKALRLFGTGV